MLQRPDKEKIREGDESEDRVVVVRERERERIVVSQGMLEENQCWEGCAAT